MPMRLISIWRNQSFRREEREITMAKRKYHSKTVDIIAIRKAIADYMYSEGCGCCQGSVHGEHENVIGKLLNVPMYKDKSGYNFSKFQSKK